MAAAKGKVATPEFSFANVAPQEVTELPAQVKVTEVNPMDVHVKNALDKGVQTFEVPDGARAKQAYDYIRRAARAYSLRVRYTTGADEALTPEQAHASTEPVWVYFLVKSEKPDRKARKARYTSQQIREWAKEMGITWTGNKIPNDVRARFRAAKGFDQRTESESN